MAEWLVRLINRLRPREGWAPFLLVLAAALSPSAALASLAGDRQAVVLMSLTVLGVLAGLWLARSRLSLTAVVITAGVVGIVLAVVFTARLIPPVALLWEETGDAIDWLEHWRQGIPRWPLPFAAAAEYGWQQLGALGIRLWWWSQSALGGGQARDPIAMLLLASVLAWTLAVFASWQVYRRRSALLGLAPGAVVIVLLAFFRGGMANFYLIIYLFCGVWLVGICHLWNSTARWQENRMDYPGNLGVELLISLGPLLLLVLAIAALFPVIYPARIRDGFWQVMEAPWSRIEQAAERVFGPIEGGTSRGATSRGGARGELPSVHLLGGRPELADTIVLYASTNDPPPPTPSPDLAKAVEPAPPRRYWRADTFDIYTGLGWANSPLESQPLAANQFLEPDSRRGPDLLQQFQRVTPGDKRVYAVNSPYRLDQTAQTWWRTSGDLAFLTADSDVYTIVSRPPQPTIAELRAGSALTDTFSAVTTERYLALPDTIPQRVLDLAREVAGAAATRFDQARAIERYLRAYPYELNIPEPPTDRDLVDYFLFELQEGYCDYYASAMVVMARAVGLPARLASGYVQGTYDYDNRRWVVTEQEAHSWVEVYFRDVGWVEFEPTGGRPELARPGGQDLPAVAVPSLPPRQVRWWQQIPWGLTIVTAVLLGLVALVLWLRRPRPAVAAAELVRDRQKRLERWGVRLGHPLGPGQTAREYSQSLSRALQKRGQRTRLAQARKAGAEVPVEIEHLAQAFEHAQYGPDPVPAREGWQVRELWIRLRRRLWWLWLSPRSKNAGHDQVSRRGRP